MRLTADGKFHLCLLNDDELDVKQTIRAAGVATQWQPFFSKPSPKSPLATASIKATPPSAAPCSKSADKNFSPRRHEVHEEETTMP
jgi:molybdenum cofactor biosynthesis enzyme MoaA